MYRLFCAQLLLFVGIITFAQESDSSSTSEHVPVKVYFAAMGEQSPLYNGREYVEYSGTIQVGHPFYNTTEFTKGSIIYEGMLFNDAMILYDIVKDKVIIRHFNQIFRIDLPVEKIQEFHLLNHHFVRLYPDSAGVIEEGFYDEMYKGKTKLYIRRRKLITEERTGTDLLQVAEQKDILYIQKEGTYHPVKTLKGLLTVFSNRSDGIRQHLRKNGIKFRKAPEAAVLTAVQYYDRLSN
ncbi:MAG TPA: hypothetical protein VFN95_18685 [Flavitalea sp.]|nr:hypothetical protein [Flavitalea sp.]